MRQSTTKSPGAVGKTAARADSKADGLPHKNTARRLKGNAYPAQTAWKKRNPLKVWAHSALRSGMKKGLVVPQPCERCGDTNAEAHHPDYSRPLMVQWLCRRHHKQVHARGAKR